MGIGLWAGSSAVAFVLARIVPLGRTRRWIGELVAAIAASALLGVVATAMDFGGWDEPDWRAGVFMLCGAIAATGIVRLVSLPRESS